MSPSPIQGKTVTHPNILLIVMDATRAKNLSCYGYQRPTTPNLERFSDQCVLYEAAISPAGWSLPAHGSLFTGLYPSRHGAHEQHKYLSPSVPTMAELLHSRGYRTVAFCGNPYVSSATGLDRGFQQFSTLRKSGWSLAELPRKLHTAVALVLDRIDSGARHINRQVKSALGRLQADKSPFFMFVHYGEPHAPYRPPSNYTRYLPSGVSRGEAKRVNQDRWKYAVDPSLMNEHDFEVLLSLYDGEITYLDSRIAQVWGWLEELGMLERTMVIITADHGENVGEHQMMGHAYCLYDTLVHVPLIIRYPMGLAGPGRIAYQVQTLDLLPTILAMLGSSTQDSYHSLQGHDLLSSGRHDFTVAEWQAPDLTTFHRRFPGADVSRYDRALRMLRTDRYKYIWASDNNHELYDLQADPEETRNILAECPDVAEGLDRLLTEWLTSFEAAIPVDDAPEFDEGIRDRLRALGYLE